MMYVKFCNEAKKTRPRHLIFSPRRDRDRDLPTFPRDRDETETFENYVSRPRRRDRDYIPGTRHKIGNFGDVLPIHSLGIVVKKLNLTEQKQTSQEQDGNSSQNKPIAKQNLNQHSTTCSCVRKRAIKWVVVMSMIVGSSKSANFIHMPLAYNTHTQTYRFMALFPGIPGRAGAERNLLDRMVQGKITGRHNDLSLIHI